MMEVKKVMNQNGNDDIVHNVLNHLTEKFGSEEKARQEVKRMSLPDLLIQNEYIKRGPQTKMVRRRK